MIYMDRRKITDPQRLKALAHPLRWKLIDVLTINDTATATQCAAAVGESVASCSYHLNMLAKYGFVEQAEGGQGREKPWRLLDRHQSYDDEGMDVDGARAAEAATEALLEHEFDRARQYLRGHDREPEPWRRMAGLTGLLSFLTADEATELRADVNALFDRYRDRAEAQKRPSGSRPVRFQLISFAIPGTEETP
ncbi:helix-turn-helix domain-containing protein [Actinokineospora soli]